MDSSNNSKVKEILGIPEDEPIFVLRAKDNIALPTIGEYISMANRSLQCDTSFVYSVQKIFNDFLKYRNIHQDRMKYPDV